MAPTAAMLLLNHHSRQSHHHHSSSPPNVTVSQVKASVEKWVSNLNGILHFQQRSEKQPTPDRKMEITGKAVQNGSSGGAH
nr:3-ketoacyl-CoA synthase [Ipomoea batatas]